MQKKFSSTSWAAKRFEIDISQVSNVNNLSHMTEKINDEINRSVDGMPKLPLFPDVEDTSSWSSTLV